MVVKLTIDRFEGDKAVLIESGGLAVVWPKNKLPQNAREGSCLNFEISEEAEYEKRQKQTAKDIINEIIG
ncbi:MAG: DUF3006 domain-containing protein [bacterium]